MKQENLRETTALGVVVFSLLSIALFVVITGLIYLIAALFVLKTEVPESFLKIASVIGAGIGIIASTSFLGAKAKLKGIVASGIVTGAIVIIKLVGCEMVGQGRGLGLWNLVGVLFVGMFSLVGGMVSSVFKNK